MAAVCNGLSLSKLRPFGSGFFIFSDYARGSVRLSALMELPVIYIWTHDSIGLGEDAPLSSDSRPGMPSAGFLGFLSPGPARWSYP
jgi:transketolase